MYSYRATLGEIVDRHCILAVKVQRLKDADKLVAAQTKLTALTKQLPSLSLNMIAKSSELQQVHFALWDHENEIREITAKLPIDDVRDWLPRAEEYRSCHDSLESYLIAANQIRKLNDFRHQLVRDLDELAGHTTEPKEYANTEA